MGARKSKAEQVSKEERAVALRRQGKNFDEIAAQVGYTDRSGAYKAVMRTLTERLAEGVDELRALELERLDKYQAAFGPLAEMGDEKALDRVVKIMERRAKYVAGLETPKQLEVDMGATIDERTAAALAMLGQIEAAE